MNIPGPVAVNQRIWTVVLGLFLLISTGMTAQAVEKTTLPVVSSGETLNYPFGGGLDAPQFSAVDLNRDGVQDVLVFDRQGNAMVPFVTVGDPGSYSYEIQWQVLQDFPRVQLWMLMLDFNGDGVEDIFCSTEEPGVQGIDVYRGRVEDNRLTFTKMTFDLGDYDVLYFKLNQGFTPVYSAWIDVPAIRDIDGDGDVDILTFEPGGSYVHFLKNTALENGLGLDTFLLEWEDECWGKFAENAFSSEVMLSASPTQCASPNIMPRHSGSAIAAYDFEGDGDQDLLVGDLSSPRIVMLTNGGTAEQAWMTEQEPLFPAGVPVDIPFFVAPFVLDISHDGLPDFVAASNNAAFSENVHVAWYYRNDGAGHFILENTNLFVSEMLDFGSEAKPAFFDYNADGLVDILVGTGGYFSSDGNRDARLVLLENTGTPDAPSFVVLDDDYLEFSMFASIPTWEFAPTAGDLDQDGDIDLLVGERNGKLFFVENIAGEGNPASFNAPVYPYADLGVGTSSTPDLVDLNGDGLLDIVCGERIGNNDMNGRCSNLNYFQNTGVPGSPQFSPDLTQAPNTQCLGRVLFGSTPGIPEFSAPAFVTTPDGFRLIMGSETGVMRVYSGIEGVFDDAYILVNGDFGGISDGGRTVPALAELDADGYYEMLIGNKRGGITLYDTDIEVMTTAIMATEKQRMAPVLLPNPSEGRISIKSDNQDFRTFKLILYDPFGRQLKTYLHCGAGQELMLPDFQGLAVAVIESEGKRFVSRIVRY